MKTAAELQLRKIALVLTAVVALQVLWSGSKLLFMAEPEPITPAAASLRVDSISYVQDLEEDQLLSSLASGPLFWQGRQAYIPPQDPEEQEEIEIAELSRNSAIDKIELLGVYAGGAKPGIIFALGGERRRLNLHQSLEGWELTMIEPEGALFENGRERKSITLTHVQPAPVAAKKVSSQKGVSKRRRVVPGDKQDKTNRLNNDRVTSKDQAAGKKNDKN